MRARTVSLMVAVVLLCSMSCALSGQDDATVVPGEPLPREIQAKVGPLLDDLQKAIAAMDENAARSVSAQIIETMGPWAGNPETAPRYYEPIERAEPSAEEVKQLWLEIDRRLRRDLLWVVVPDGDPARMKSALRTAGRPVIAYALLAQLVASQQKEHVALVREGADYLLKIQRDDGLFPVPDLRGSHRLFGPMIEKLLKQKPGALVDGWIVDDLSGDLQYGNGICGVAMVAAYEVTKDARYLESARRASHWAKQRPLCTNWNYNAFSVWLLARYARASGDREYLDAAVAKLRVGVLPGQMKNGRWFDPHNAKLVYHAIIVRGMLEVYRCLGEGDAFRTPLRRALVLALDNAADEIREHGASSNTTTTEVLSDALGVLGPNARWQEALNINVNAGLRVVRDRRAPNVGMYLPHYLWYRSVTSR